LLAWCAYEGDMSEHPTELDLDLLRSGEAGAEIAHHVAGCARCQSELARIGQAAAALAMPVAPIEVPASRDRAILTLAQQRAAAVAAQLERQRRPRWLRPLYVAAPLAAAASVMLFVTLARSPALAPSAAPPQIAASSDINGDGAVDIVDALLLARLIKLGQQALDPSWDQNRDGRVDQADIDRIAQGAVALQRGQP
jgi:hypothetical protein